MLVSPAGSGLTSYYGALTPAGRAGDRAVIVTRGSVLAVTELDQVPVIVASTALLHGLGMRYVGYDGAYVKLWPGTATNVLGPPGAIARRGGGCTGNDQL